MITGIVLFTVGGLLLLIALSTSDKDVNLESEMIRYFAIFLIIVGFVTGMIGTLMNSKENAETIPQVSETMLSGSSPESGAGTATAPPSTAGTSSTVQGPKSGATQPVGAPAHSTEGLSADASPVRAEAGNLRYSGAGREPGTGKNMMKVIEWSWQLDERGDPDLTGKLITIEVYLSGKLTKVDGPLAPPVPKLSLFRYRTYSPISAPIYVIFKTSDGYVNGKGNPSLTLP